MATSRGVGEPDTVAELAGLGVWLLVRGDDSTPGAPDAGTSRPALDGPSTDRCAAPGGACDHSYV